MKIGILVSMLALMAGSIPGQAGAVTKDNHIFQTGANMCRASNPATGAMLRPKATGFSNDGTTNTFVICTFDAPSGIWQIDEGYSVASLVLKTLDGELHHASCTAVNSLPDMQFSGLVDTELPANPIYVTKNVDVYYGWPHYSFGNYVTWTPADFGFTDKIHFSGGALSITCQLPPHVAVILGMGQSEEDVGN